MRSGTLCNACGVRLKAAGALREQVHRPPPATARTVAEPPPESPVADSSPDGPIWEPGSVPDVYLLRKKPPKRGRSPPPRTEPASPPAPAVFLVKKKKKKAPKTPNKKPWRPRKSAKRCLHCGSSSTPQWREGPMGRSTLCNACGVRYRQGRLLPEYRPLVSPTFEPSEHANRHSQVLQLHRQRKGHQKNQQPLPTEEPRPVDHPTGAPPCSGSGDGLASSVGFVAGSARAHRRAGGAPRPAREGAAGRSRSRGRPCTVPQVALAWRASTEKEKEQQQRQQRRRKALAAAVCRWHLSPVDDEQHHLSHLHVLLLCYTNK